MLHTPVPSPYRKRQTSGTGSGPPTVSKVPPPRMREKYPYKSVLIYRMYMICAGHIVGFIFYACVIFVLSSNLILV